MRINIDLLRNILLDIADCPASTVANSHCFTYPQTSQAEIKTVAIRLFWSYHFIHPAANVAPACSSASSIQCRTFPSGLISEYFRTSMQASQ